MNVKNTLSKLSECYYSLLHENPNELADDAGKKETELWELIEEIKDKTNDAMQVAQEIVDNGSS